MVSRSISKQTIKKLFALSGNQCVFTDCNEELITEGGTVVSEMCHIEGIAPKAPRHNQGKITARCFNRTAHDGLVLKFSISSEIKPSQHHVEDMELKVTQTSERF